MNTKKNTKKIYEIWMGKYWTDIAPGQFTVVPVQRLASIEALNFPDACQKYVKSLGHEKHFKKSTMRYGPTKLFPTQQEAEAAGEITGG